MHHFPVRSEVSIYLTNGKDFAAASGPEVIGDVAGKPSLLTAIAAAVLATESQTQLKGWRLPTPTEFVGEVLRENFGMRVAVPVQPKEWDGFTQAELDAEVRRLREAPESNETQED